MKLPAARGTRVANRLLKRVRDYAEIRAQGYIDLGLPKRPQFYWKLINWALIGGRRLLRTIIEKIRWGPGGLRYFGRCRQQETDTIEEVYEPIYYNWAFCSGHPGPGCHRHGCELLGIEQRQLSL